MKIYTIGHSVHTKETFINMLAYANIEVLADVRRFPASSKHPQFSQERMQKWLPEAWIEYIHFTSLAGRRNKSTCFQEELNDGWNNQSFHNYADYTLTNTFQKGIQNLEQIARKKTLAYCCSERHPSRCHRLLISNWLSANGWEVCHIIDGNKQETEILPHQQGQWGAMPIIDKDGTVVYPGV
jgi:uncharacterized protein (DUF488 family)